MSTTQKLYATAFAFLDYENQGSNVHTGDTQVLKTTQDAILIKFDELPSSLRYKRIMAINAYVYAINVGTYRYFSLAAEANTKNFDEETETFESWGYGGISAGLPSSTDYKELPGWLENIWEGNGIAEAATHGILIRGRKNGSTQEFKDLTVTTGGANRPYIDVIVDESTTADTLSIASLSPKSGSINKAQPNVFTWAVKAPYACVPKLEQCSAVFRWRTAAGATEHAINISGDTKSVTIPAGTFTGTSIQWQIALTANSGKVTTSDWITLSTADATSTATAQSPKGEIVDASEPVVFKWSHIISTGTAQTKAELQISTDMQTWTALATVTGAATTYTVPANTLGSGTKYWRVRTYNTDNAAGAWSDAAEFICVGAPDTPPVSIQTQGPRPTIKWQSADQLAYQVEIVGVYASGTYYGTDKTWTAPMYLEDGEYTVRVRVKNEYALWSPWGAAALQVANTPTAEITLTAEGDALRPRHGSGAAAAVLGQYAPHNGSQHQPERADRATRREAIFDRGAQHALRRDDLGRVRIPRGGGLRRARSARRQDDRGKDAGRQTGERVPRAARGDDRRRILHKVSIRRRADGHGGGRGH